MHFNQHFSKKNIEAAIRVALVMPNQDIMVNGERSNNQVSFYYSKEEGKLYFNKVFRFTDENDFELIALFDISSRVKAQKSTERWICKVVDIALSEYKKSA
jgi:hypothetical protein